MPGGSPNNAGKDGFCKSHRASARGPQKAMGMIEQLEPRKLMTATIVEPFASVSAQSGQSATVIPLSNRFSTDSVNGTVVRLETSLGVINLELFDQAITGRSAAPVTSANFLNYVNSGRYDNTFFHRLVTPFILQGGGFTANLNSQNNLELGFVNQDPAIVNEFSEDRSNIRGTVAMAKLEGQPNSASAQFFFNLQNNADFFDAQNGGFTVFARVLDDPGIIDGLEVVDAIAAVPVSNLSTNPGEIAPFLDTVPLRNFSSNQTQLLLNNLVLLNDANVISPFGFTVSSSNQAAVTAEVVTNNQGLPELRLAYPAGPGGTSTINLTARDVTGSVVSTSFSVTALPGGDLSTTVTDVTPANLLPGGKFRAAASVTNVGTVAVRGRTTLQLLLSTDATASTDDIVLRTTSTNLNLRAGAAKAFRSNLVLPTTVASGNYSLLAVVDAEGAILDGNRTNNTGVRSPIVVQPATVNLQPVFSTSSMNLVAGKNSTVAVNLTNTGNILARGQASVSFEIDTNNDGIRETVLGSSQANITLKPGQQRRVNFRLLTPSDASPFTGTLTGVLSVNSGFTDANTQDNVFSTQVTIA